MLTAVVEVDGITYACDAGQHLVATLADGAPAPEPYAGLRGAPGRVDGSRLQARFHGPRALAVEPAGGTLFVADAGNQAVRCIDLRAGVVNTRFVLADLRALAPVLEFTPSGLACDGELLVVADPRNHALWSYQLRTHRLALFAGRPGQHGDQDGPRERARFWLPTGVALAPDGRGFVVQEARGRRLVSRAGEVFTPGR